MRITACQLLFDSIWVQMRKYTKKVIVTDEKSTHEARAERVKRVRNLANLSRKEICNDGTLNINTYKGWELGRYGGLPLDGADKIVTRVAKEGVICAPEWLLYGIGESPKVITDFTQIKKIEKTGSASFRLDDAEQESVMLEELLLFRNHFNDITYMIVSDDGMLPFYKPGEFVAGVPRYGDKIQEVVNFDCIVQIDNGQILLRSLRKGNQTGLYTLISINTQSTIKEPVIYNAKLLSAAPIIRHLRKNP